MPAGQEAQVGAQEHQKVLKEYGIYKDNNLQSYVNNVGQNVVRGTERPDVRYQFFLLDSPMVNAFALPGGYIYITRGLMALANSEAEMAAVLAHESGHITGRHAAERYSRGVVTQLGAAILASAVGSDGVTQALGLGSDLYLKSYSRGQESQADSLGIRYLSRAGYHPLAMSKFLENLQADTALESRISGKGNGGTTDYFSTHPATAERVVAARSESFKYPQQGAVEHESYLYRLNGMIYGDSPDQGFVRGQNFYHPNIGFTFSVPNGYKIINQPSQVVAGAQSGAVIIFDMVNNPQGFSPARYMQDVWMKGEPVAGLENIDVNGMDAVTAGFNGSVNGKPMTIRMVAINWGGDKIARFQIGIPSNIGSAEIQAIKASTYSFRQLGRGEVNSVRPYRISIVTARAGDSAASMASRMAMPEYKLERFMVLNGLKPNEGVIAGQPYKIIVE